MLNQLNNIETRNYNVSISEITKQEQEQKNTSESNEGKEQSGSGSSSGSSSGESNGSNTDSGSNTQENEKRYEIEQMGILLENNNDIPWDRIKGEVETLYTSIPTITLDLYQVKSEKDDILGFNRELDKVAMILKEEYKEKTLDELAMLYEYIPKFIQKATDDEKTKKLAEVKQHLYKAYSKINTGNWEEIGNEITEAVNIYNNLLSNTNIDTAKQYNISKTYVMLNELKSPIELEDDKVFLIKYKNIVEEINNLSIVFL